MTKDIQSIFIAVITHKRPKGLEKLLAALVKQKISTDMNAQICVIDNDLIGHNIEVVSKFTKSNIPIVLVEEKEKSIVAARNRAVDTFLETTCDALIFIDDDEWPNNDDWLVNIVRACDLSASDIVMGDVYTQGETPQINWAQDAMARIKKNRRNLQPIIKFYTNNLLVKRHVFENIKPAFDDRFSLTGGADLHFSMRCKKAEYRAVYTNQAAVTEFFPQTRSSLKWFMLRGYRVGSGATRAEIYENSFGVAVLKSIFLSVARFGYGLGKLLMGLIRMNKGLRMNGVMRMGAGVGTIAGLFNFSYDEYATTHGE